MLAYVFTGPRRGRPALTEASCRSTLTVLRRKSTRSTVRLNNSPWRIPVEAAKTTRPWTQSGTADAIACTCSVVMGDTLARSTLGRRMPVQGEAGMRRSRTAALKTTEVIR
jgi:hypothetical protein